MTKTANLKSIIRKVGAKSVTFARAVLPPSIQDRVPARLRRLAGKVLNSGKSRSQRVEDRLWGGFSQSALAELSAIADDETAKDRKRVSALHNLGSWSAVEKDYETALGQWRRAAEISPKLTNSLRHRTIEAQLLCHLGRAEEVRTVLEEEAEGAGFNCSRELLLANSWNIHCVSDGELASPERMLDHLNAIYRQFGLCEIRAIDKAAPLSMDNIEGFGFEPVSDPDRAVTIIVPAYNAAETIGTTLRSISQQSWQSYRVLVVDDCSTDDTCARVEAFCKTDDRFALVRKTENSGTYMSRNLALEMIDTPYVTVHDADDWSHPQKLERQMMALSEKGGLYNYTMLVRATPDLVFMSEAKPASRLLVPNHWAGLFKADDVRKAGGWDRARISADTELFWRLEALNGNLREKARERRVLVDCPLAIGRVLPGSLTQMGPTHTLTMNHGVRREYREAADFWHRTQMREGAYKAPFFPAPGLIRPGVPAERRHDLFLIADFTSQSLASRSALQKAVVAARGGRDVAVMQYRGYHLDVTRPLPWTVRQLAGEHGIRIVAPGETVEARVAAIEEIGLLKHRLDRFPIVKTDVALVSVNRLPQADHPNPFSRYEPAAIAETGAESFGQAVRWAPVSPLAERQMRADGRFTGAAEPVFWPCLMGEAIEPGTARAHGLRRKVPVVGHFFQGQDGKFADAARGWAQHRMLTMSWQGLTLGAPGIDVFLYFPDAETSEPLGLPAALAMTYGVPVITLPQFEVNFGDAALYCEPGDAFAMAKDLWSDAGRWAEAGAKGQAFASGRFGQAALLSRLDVYGDDSNSAISPRADAAL